MTLDRIWAPWRLSYVQGEKPAEPQPVQELLEGAEPDCFLCQAAAADADDRARLVIGRTSETVSLLNRYPYNNGHLLIAPRRHVANLTDLSAEERRQLLDVLTDRVELLRAKMNPNGFNVGLNLGRVAGAGLPGHLHWHVVPRWDGDTNFMPTTAGVRVIPQSLEALWEHLCDAETP